MVEAARGCEVLAVTIPLTRKANIHVSVLHRN